MEDKNTDKNTRDAILQAAEREFSQKGFDSARTVQIAEAAGVTHAMLHYYFGTKENLYNVVFEQKLESLQAMMKALAEDSGSRPEDWVRKMVSMQFSVLQENRNLIPFFLNEINAATERGVWMIRRMAEVVAVVVAGLEQKLAAYAREGIFRRVSATDLMYEIVTLNLGVFVLLPVVRAVFQPDFSDEEAMLRARCEENVQTILQRLRAGGEDGR